MDSCWQSVSILSKELAPREARGGEQSRYEAEYEGGGGDEDEVLSQARDVVEVLRRRRCRFERG